MTKFTIGTRETGEERNASLEDVLELVLGHSVVSAAVSEDSMELGLSGRRMLRLFAGERAPEVNVVSTLNAGELPRLTLSLPETSHDLAVGELEVCLRGLRRLHALALLDQAGRWSDIGAALVGSHLELDQLLVHEERLFIESASVGSWYLTLFCKVKESYAALLRVFSMLYDRGRESYLRGLEADTDVKELKAAEARFHLGVEKTDYVLKLLDRLPDDASKDAARRFVIESVRDILKSSPREDSPQSANRLLDPPSPNPLASSLRVTTPAAHAVPLPQKRGGKSKGKKGRKR